MGAPGSRIVLAVTGSVAAIRAPRLALELRAGGAREVRVALTGAGAYFWDRAAGADAEARAEVERCGIPVSRDADEWPDAYAPGDPVPHIELRRWGSALVLAPLDANTLAKITHGLCDNLATCVYRAWDWSRPVVAAPAMNTMMWNNPPTAEQIEALRARGAWIVGPVEKTLACGDFGPGAMAPPEAIAATVAEALARAAAAAAASGAGTEPGPEPGPEPEPATGG